MTTPQAHGWPEQPPARTPPEPDDRTWNEMLVLAFGALGLTFGLSLAWWWLAHQMTWWAYGLVSTVWLAGFTGLNVWHKERKAAKQRQADELARLRALARAVGRR